jgi:hypothetical protein
MEEIRAVGAVELGLVAITNQMLYQLSYASLLPVSIAFTAG